MASPMNYYEHSKSYEPLPAGSRSKLARRPPGKVSVLEYRHGTFYLGASGAAPAVRLASAANFLNVGP